eukprot:4188651-Pyramimonas_sp.AAC.1
MQMYFTHRTRRTAAAKTPQKGSERPHGAVKMRLPRRGSSRSPPKDQRPRNAQTRSHMIATKHVKTVRSLLDSS